MDKELYRLQANTEKCISLIPSDIDFCRSHFIGKRMRFTWKPPEIIKIHNKSKKLSDFLSWMLQVPVFSSKAVEILSPILDDYVEFLPLITLRKIEYFAVNVLCMIDCLDKSRSDLTYSKEESEKVIFANTIYLNESLIKNEPIFKIPQWQGCVFVSRTFVDQIIKNKLKGAIFADPKIPIFTSIMGGYSANVVPNVPE